MKLNRAQLILIVLLVVQVAGAAFVLWPRPAAGGAGAPLLGELKAQDITALTVTDGDGASVKLAAAGDGWIAPDAAGYPVEAAQVTALLDKLVSLGAGRLVSQTEESLARLQVAPDAFVRKIALQTADGETTLYLGSSAGTRGCHVRLDGSNDVYLAGNLATWEVDADLLSWIDSAYLTVQQADVNGLTLRNAQGELTIEKDASGGWSFVGSDDAVDATKVSALLNELGYLRMTAPLGKTEEAAYGLAEPSAVVELTTGTGDQEKKQTLTIGAIDTGDDSHAVKSSESEWYVRVAATSVTNLVKQTREGLLPATPTPELTPTPAGAETPTPEPTAT